MSIHVADRCNCPMLQTITNPNSKLFPLRTSLHLAMLSYEHRPICVHFDCRSGTYVNVILRVGANTTVTRLLLTRCDCRYLLHIVLSTVQFAMTNVKLAWDKTRCHAFAICHRTILIASSSAYVA